jgi:Tfp pilus assembly protein PilE
MKHLIIIAVLSVLVWQSYTKYEASRNARNLSGSGRN